MPNTYTQLYIQIVFAVKHRQALINEQIREELHKYITGILINKKHKLLAIYAMPDHLHLFIGMNPDVSLSSLVKEIKVQTNSFINAKMLTGHPFHWQKGYGAFSYAKSQKHNVIEYILHQKEHHQKNTFRKEYLEFLRIFEIDYDEKYLFEFFD
ncbi:MAG TPA: IS200/IS605 family transposase [Bacteroidales bacterium]|nr:IS200/IS605 family transposase [Bacteroidales bacterium]